MTAKGWNNSGFAGSSSGGGSSTSTVGNDKVMLAGYWDLAVTGGRNILSTFNYSSNTNYTYNYCIPFVPTMTEYDQIFMRTSTTAAGETCHLSVYEADSNSGCPIGAPVTTVDLPMDAVAVFRVDLASNWVPEAGKKYWIVFTIPAGNTNISAYKLGDAIAPYAQNSPHVKNTSPILRVNSAAGAGAPTLDGTEVTNTVTNAWLYTGLRSTTTAGLL